MAKQFNFSDIDELKKYAETMNTTLPENISKILSREKFNDNYKIYGETYDDFINIGTFYMNSYVKDSMYLDNVDYADSEFGKLFKEYMIKYYDQGLTNDEIKNLLEKIFLYNGKVIQNVRKAPILYLFTKDKGPYDFLSSLLNKIKEELETKYNGNDTKLKDLDEYFNLFNRAEYYVLTQILNSFSNLRVGAGLNSTNELFSNIIGNSGFLDKIYLVKTVDNAKLEKTESYKSVKVKGEEILALDSNGNKIDFRKEYTYKYLYNKRFEKENTVRAIDSIISYDIEDTTDRTAGELIYFKDIDNNEIKPITYTDSGGALHYFCKTTTTTTFEDSNGIESDISALLNEYSLYIKHYIDAKINSMKILYEIEASKASINKLGASYEEANKTYKYNLVTPINLMAVSLTNEEFQEWKKIIKFDDDFRQSITYLEVSSPTQIVIQLDIGIIYKELNPNYRDALLSDYVDYMLGVLSCYNYLTTEVNVNSTVIINPELDKILREMRVNDNYFLLYDKEVLKRVINLYSNNYLARKSTELEIIRFFADSQSLDEELTYIGFGSKSVDKDEIYTFLDIYNTVRNYYFTRLLNKAFINDDYYVPFEKFFLGLIAIEKFLSSRISNMRDIDKFTEEDVHNFLLSYGLKSIDESAVFSNQIEYKKDIIKNYNTLMKSKGSLNCLNKLYEIFTARTDGLNLSRYYLVNDRSNPDNNKMKFVPCSYNNDNLTKELFTNLEKSREYGDLVNNDDYWDEETLTEDSLIEKGVDVIPTKYNLLDLIEDIRSKYITTQYLTSLIHIIQSTLKQYDAANENKPIFDFYFKIESDEALGGGTFTLNDYLDILLELFNIYNSYYYDKFKKAETDKALSESESSVNKKYYGFDLAGISNLISNDKYKKYLTVKNFNDYKILSLEEHFFNEINMKDSGVNGLSSVNLLKNYLIGLNLLYLLQQTKDVENNSSIIAEYCKTIDTANSTNFEISAANLSNIIFKNILLFPLDYLNDLQIPGEDRFGNSKFIDNDFMLFTDNLFENVYKTDTTPYEIHEDKIEIKSENTKNVFTTQFNGVTIEEDNKLVLSSLDNSINGLMEIIIKMADNITNILNMDGKFFNLGLSNDSSNLLKFLIESFKIFFSYTSQLSETANIWEYKTPSEYCSPYDYVDSSATYSLVDTNQYDEELIIIKQGGSSNE